MTNQYLNHLDGRCGCSDTGPYALCLRGIALFRHVRHERRYARREAKKLDAAREALAWETPDALGFISAPFSWYENARDSAARLRLVRP